MGQTFGYIVVGAGSSGAVLANRLTEDPDVTVCLIEAGPDDRNPLIHMPLGLIGLMKSPRANWLFSSTPQSGLNGRTVSIPRGKVLGGSSSLNGMVYIRGHRQDYDDWSEAGCTGWGYDSVLPYFKRAEANTNMALSDALHGRDGPLSVTNLRDPNPLNEVFAEAAGQVQFPRCPDFNVPEPEGVGTYQVTQKNGKRHSTAAAYLSPIKGRKNLHILTGAEVRAVTVQDRRAKGVTVQRSDGSVATIRASHEVILSAGSIGSPDLLLRSGIGPAADIAAAGCDVVLDLPGVGQNLQDHVDIMLINATRSAVSHGISLRAMPRLVRDGLRWITANRGLLSSNMVEAGGFIRSDAGQPRPDLQFTFIPGRKSHRGRMIEWGHGVALHTCILRPQSRGRVTRTTPAGRPQIDLGLLNAERDVALLVKAARIARQVLAGSPFGPHGLTEILPGAAVQSDDDLRAFVKAHAKTIYHPVGTCAMGTGPGAVVDSRLRLHGIEGLRVVDCSIMPTIVSGNTNAPAIMIAEKAADMIREDRMAG